MFTQSDFHYNRATIAAMAMQGMCANPAYTTTPVEHVAEWAVQQADALLVELQKPVAPPEASAES
jgi:hypothetical protein